jgi:hypothetical protein
MLQAAGQFDLNEAMKTNKQLRPMVDNLKRMAEDLEKDKFPSPQKLSDFSQALLQLRGIVPDNVLENAFPKAMALAQFWLSGGRQPGDTGIGVPGTPEQQVPSPPQMHQGLR